MADAAFTAYLAPKGFERELLDELGDVGERHGRLMLAPGAPRPAAWAQNVWLRPRRLRIESIADAARQLRSMQRNWVRYAEVGPQRRAALIEAKLPPIRFRPHRFGEPAPSAPLGSWALLDHDTLLASPTCSSPFPHGEARFAEDRHAPPSRAYLKLWEAFTLLGARPAPGERCLDLGSSPGGWTWVLQQLGAHVTSVDKAPLAPGVARLPRVDFRRQSAFALSPAQLEPFDWLFSDVICYPERLLRLVQQWLEAGKARRFLCSVKLQGSTDHATLRRFAAVPGSRLMHLSCNRHELTWVKLA